jgi:uncharacterized membrane protein
VLPLAESSTDGETPTLSQIVDSSGAQILLLLLSFAVICRFWLSHHNIMRSLVAFDPPLFWANALWVFSIVLLPYTTGLIGTASSDNSAATGIYIGNMLLTCLAALAMQWHVTRTPSLQSAESRGTARLQPSLITTITLVIALAIAVPVPAIGAWSLLLLALDGVVSRLLNRRRTTPDARR